MGRPWQQEIGTTRSVGVSNGRSKSVYRVKNWPEYNAGLIARGDVTIWMHEAMLCPVIQALGRRGCPQADSDGMIQLFLTLKSV